MLPYDYPIRHIRGVFGLYGHRGSVAVEMPDGEYENLIAGESVTVCNGAAIFDGTSFVIAF